MRTKIVLALTVIY